MANHSKYEYISNTLLIWYSKHSRIFYWRLNPTPFVVLIAEILLRKTSAKSVNEYLPYFLKQFNTVTKLNNISEKKLTQLLQPLGLSAQRAKQLKQLALHLKRNNNNVPSDRQQLLDIPGVGDYTAGAVLSFAFGKAEAIVDTNVARIIIRVWDIKPSRYEARRSPEIWDIAGELVKTKPDQSNNLNWALLDLGAIICKTSKPKCEECPLVKVCCYYIHSHN